MVTMSEAVLEKPEGRVSYHDSVEEMLIRVRDDGLSSVFSRWDEQEKIRCRYCLAGMSCWLCIMGAYFIRMSNGYILNEM